MLPPRETGATHRKEEGGVDHCKASWLPHVGFKKACATSLVKGFAPSAQFWRTGTGTGTGGIGTQAGVHL